MEDTALCPICHNKLRSLKLINKYLHPIDKKGFFYERICSRPNHTVHFFADGYAHQIDYLRFSLDHRYSKFLEIDFVHKKCRIVCFKLCVPSYIEIPKMIEPDFPLLKNLKSKISMYVTFS